MIPSRWHQIEAIYHQALEHQPSERAAYLAEACAEDTELRCEVESLLVQNPSKTNVLDRPAWEGAAGFTGVDSAMTSITPGTQLGPYKIEGPLGKGGMGEVFRATDTRLHRAVAIKVLPHDKVADPERKKRFPQEARAASALNHPNIVTLHDIASDNGIDYLVMAFVPGKSLDKLITPKGLPLAEALFYAEQIASGLAAAHAAGIVHRDMKPANVIIGPESEVKILDFGLAKLIEPASGGEDETRTQEPALTEDGMVMGTVAYMSPEQASAKRLDSRTDIFSLGIMLYEMVAGERPFRGKSPIETMHAIIHHPAPPLSAQSPELNDIIDKAIAKDTKDRYQHAGDLGLDLRRVRRGRSFAAPGSRPSAMTRLLWPSVAAIVALSFGLHFWISRRPATPENPLDNAKFTRLTAFEGDEFDGSISPDGRFVTFLSDRDGPLDIWLTQVGTGEMHNITQGKITELKQPLRSVGISGDGSEIWFKGPGINRIQVLPLMGGGPRAFLGPTAAGVAWSPDGLRLAYHTRDPGDPLFIAERTGANARQIFGDSNSGMHNHFPVWSQDGQSIYFSRGRQATNEMDLWRIAVSGGPAERLTHQDSSVAYPTPIDSHTVMYVSRDIDGSGPWLWAFDSGTKITRRVSFGLEQYTSLSATADGRRLVATIANSQASLWAVPILDHPAEERDVKPFSLPTNPKSYKHFPLIENAVANWFAIELSCRKS